MEEKIGSLEPDKHADIGVWTHNPLEANLEDIRDLEIEIPLVEGVIKCRK